MTLGFLEHVSGLKDQVLEFFLFSFYSPLTSQYLPRRFSYYIHKRHSVQGTSKGLIQILIGSDHPVVIFHTSQSCQTPAFQASS